MRQSDRWVVARFERGLTFTTALKVVLACIVGGSVVLSAFVPQVNVSIVVIGVLGLWMFLTYRSVRNAQVASLSPMLIASGQFEEAEEQLDLALKRFSVFRNAKLVALHHLAMLRHAQRRWADAAVLCKALLRQRLGTAKNLSRSTRLMLADSMLELGDLPGAFHALQGLYREKLALNEALNLLAIQTDYLARIGAWGQIFDGLSAKLQMVELMPAPAAARTQAFIALAARHTGRADIEQFLKRRVELLADVEQLKKGQPILGALWD